MASPNSTCKSRREELNTRDRAEKKYLPPGPSLDPWAKGQIARALGGG